MGGYVGHYVVVALVGCRVLAVGGEEEGTDIATEIWACLDSGCGVALLTVGLTLGNGLYESPQNKSEVVARIEAVPESAGCESSETGSESWFLAFRCHSEVHVVPKPEVSIDVPALEEGPRVLCRFDTPGIDVLQPIPFYLSCLGIHTVVAQTG